MIAEYPELKAVPKKWLVHDAANNMKGSIAYITGGASSVLCADHLLNTCLLKACNKNEEVKTVIETATRLSSKMHRSTLACELLQRECREIDCEYIKIQSPVITRWNSNFLMIESILKLRRPLVQLREKGHMDHNVLCEVVPTDEQFNLLDGLLPVLRTCKVMSDQFSKDTEISMDKAAIYLFRLDGYLNKYPVGSLHQHDADSHVLRNFCRTLLEELNKDTRFNDKGKHIKPYINGNLFHPYYRGQLLQKYKIYDEVVKELIDNHPTTAEFNATRRNDASLNEDQMRVDLDDFSAAEELWDEPQNVRYKTKKNFIE